MLLLLILLPAASALLSLLLKGKAARLLSPAVGFVNLLLAAVVLARGLSVVLPIELHGFVFSFDAAHSAAYLLLAAIVFFAGSLWMNASGLFGACALASLSMVNGALLANHLGLLLLFWEGLLLTLFGMLAGLENPRALKKGFALAGTADLILMLGVAATTHAARTGVLSEISGLPAAGIGAMGAICLLLGALGKAGAFPFHSWMPDAAEDAPAPFAALFPGALYAVLGGYLAVRTVSMYDIAGTSVRTLLLVIGLMSLIGGALVSLAQESRRRAVSYVGVAQAGLIALAVGAGARGASIQVFVCALGVAGLQIAVRAGKRGRIPAAIFAIVLSGFPAVIWFRALGGLGVPAAILALLGLLLNALALIRLVADTQGAVIGAAKKLPCLPVIRTFYAVQARGFLDPYNWLMGVLGAFARICRLIEIGVSWVYDVGVPSAVKAAGNGLSRFDDGTLSRYLTLAVVGMLVVGAIFIIVLL